MNTRILCQLMAVLFTLCSISLKAQTSADINIVFIGNSITAGALLKAPAVEAPPARVGEILRQKTINEIRVSNQGHSGSTTLQWLPGEKNLNGAIKAGQEFQKSGGHLVFSLMLGTNDSAEKGPKGAPVSPEDYRKNMERIIGQLLQEFPESRVVVNYPLWYSPTTHNGALYKEKGLARLQTYHPVITSLVGDMQKAGKRVYAGSSEVFGAFEGQQGLFTPENGRSGTFYLHPNKEGANKLAEFWAQSILEVAKDWVVTDSRAIEMKALIKAAETSLTIAPSANGKLEKALASAKDSYAQGQYSRKRIKALKKALGK